MWIEGFESYGATDNAAPENMVHTYPSLVGSGSFRINAGRLEGKSLNIGGGGSTSHITTKNLGNVSTIVVGFAIRWIGALAAARLVGLREDDDATDGFNLRVTAAGYLEAYRGTTLLKSTSPVQALTQNQWHYVEVKVTVHNSAGAFEVRVDGSNVLSDSSVNTRAGSTNNHCNRVRFHGSNFGINSAATLDDVYILDTTGAVNNDFLGNRRVTTIFPNAPGSSTQWTPDTGNNYARVNNVASDGDSSYVQSSTPALDTYEFENVSYDSIDGIMMKTIARVTDVTPYDLINVANGGESSPVEVASNSYAAVASIFEGIDDVGECGVKLE